MRYICLCLGLSLTIFSSACRQDGAPSTSTVPASAPEQTDNGTATETDENLTYVPDERFGKLTGFTLESDLEFLYGDQVVPAKIGLGEGLTAPGYRLFPGTDDEAELLFPGEESGIDALTVRLTKPGSGWRMPGKSFTIGTSLTELEKLNGEAVTFLGYGWDYGGTIVDWQGGKLENIGGTLSYPELPDGEDLPPALLGDGEVSSGNPLLEGKDIHVKEIIIALPAPEASEDGIPEVTNYEIVPASRFGALPASVEPNDLEFTYGVANVEPMDYDLPGGVSIPGFRLFPGTKNEVEVGFPDEDGHLDAVEFRISNEGSDWHIAGTDIRVGDRLSKVRNANRKPLLIYSHNMEGGGQVNSWENGRLAGTGMQFATSTVGKDYEYDEEYNVSSDTEAVKASNPKVEMITVQLSKQ